MREKHRVKPFELDDDKLIKHRREKKLKNAIKTKNIREVMDLGDEGTFYY